MDSTTARRQLTEFFQAGVNAAMPEKCLPRHLPKTPPKGRTLVLGAGKAAASMAATAEQMLAGDFSGFVVTRYGHGLEAPLSSIEVMEAAHPVPDDMSQQAARRMIALAESLCAEDRLIFLASGGGSSLLAAPASGLQFVQKQALMRHLLHSGAPIRDINCVRRHLSNIKGGHLAKAAGAAEVYSYIISDVPGDQPFDVASGPTVADPTTLANARAVIERFGAPDKDLIFRLLENAEIETVKHAPALWHTRLVATAADSLAAAEKAAQKAGLKVINLGPNVEGEAREVGAAHARLALDARQGGQPTLILSGGETTVTVENPAGAGGRNMEYALGLVLALDGAGGIHALAADTDGVDGSEDAAGAFVHPDTLSRAAALGLNGKDHLRTNTSHGFFLALGDLMVTGPTRTNVNDFRAILISP